MPKARSDEYLLPSPGAWGALDASLTSINVVRHPTTTREVASVPFGYRDVDVLEITWLSFDLFIIDETVPRSGVEGDVVLDRLES